MCVDDFVYITKQTLMQFAGAFYEFMCDVNTQLIANVDIILRFFFSKHISQKNYRNNFFVSSKCQMLCLCYDFMLS